MEKLLTTKELSDLLGYSVRTLYEWTHIGFIPHYKFLGGIRFKASAIQKWLNEKERKGRPSLKLKI